MILKGQTPVIAARERAIGGIKRTQLIIPQPVRVLPIATTAATERKVIRVADTFLFKRLRYLFMESLNVV